MLKTRLLRPAPKGLLIRRTYGIAKSDALIRSRSCSVNCRAKGRAASYPRLARSNLFDSSPAFYTFPVNTNPDPRMEQAAPPPENDPRSAGNANSRRWRVIAAAVGGILAGTLLMGTGTARAAWQEIAQLLSLHGKPEPVSANVLSEHETEVLDRMTPQNQAQLLLERSINHYRGANDQIAERVEPVARENQARSEIEFPLHDCAQFRRSPRACRRHRDRSSLSQSRKERGRSGRP